MSVAMHDSKGAEQEDTATDSTLVSPVEKIMLGALLGEAETRVVAAEREEREDRNTRALRLLQGIAAARTADREREKRKEQRKRGKKRKRVATPKVLSSEESTMQALLGFHSFG